MPDPLYRPARRPRRHGAHIYSLVTGPPIPRLRRWREPRLPWGWWIFLAMAGIGIAWTLVIATKPLAVWLIERFP